MIKKAVVLCGGLGTRFLPISKSVPKEMMPLLDKPIIQVLLEELRDAGIEQVMIILGRGKEALCNHFDRNIEIEQRIKDNIELFKKDQSSLNIVEITYRRCLEPRGTADALNMAKNFIGNDPFVMMFGDEVLFGEKSTTQQLVSAYEKYQQTVIAVQPVDRKEVYKYGICALKEIEKGYYQVTKIVEKPKVEEAPSNISYIGGAILKPDIFDEIPNIKPNAKGEFVLTDGFAKMAQENKIFAKEIIGNRQDMGNKLGFIKANVEAGLLDNEISTELKNFLKSICQRL